MSETSLILSLPYLQPSQAQKHVTHNEALRRLDLLVQTVVQDRDRFSAPVGPVPGQCHIVGGGATGMWAGQTGKIAHWNGTSWEFHAPQPGWQAQVLAEDRAVVFDGLDWSAQIPVLENLDGVGIGTGSDATNRLAVASTATLLSHDGAGHQVKVNKATAGDTASLVFQTGYSGRAEMGTAGSDAFAIKISPDGVNWSTGLSFDPASGQAVMSSGVQVSQAVIAQADITDVEIAGGDIAGVTLTGCTISAPTVTGGDISGAQITGAQITGGQITNPQVDGAITGSAVQQTVSDATLGRVMKVGAFGLGLHSPDVTDLNLTPLGSFTTTTQITEGDVVTAHTPSLGGADTQARWFNTTSFGHATRQTQIASHVFAAGNLKHRGRLFTRVKHDANWHGWYEIYHQNTILGPVSQDAGRPTGAILERGSNANGRYVRFADGTQICTNDNAPITSAPAAFAGPITKVDGDKLWLGRWF